MDESNLSSTTDINDLYSFNASSGCFFTTESGLKTFKKFYRNKIATAIYAIIGILGIAALAVITCVSNFNEYTMSLYVIIFTAVLILGGLPILINNFFIYKEMSQANNILESSFNHFKKALLFGWLSNIFGGIFRNSHSLVGKIFSGVSSAAFEAQETYHSYKENLEIIEGINQELYSNSPTSSAAYIGEVYLRKYKTFFKVTLCVCIALFIFSFFIAILLPLSDAKLLSFLRTAYWVLGISGTSIIAISVSITILKFRYYKTALKEFERGYVKML